MTTNRKRCPKCGGLNTERVHVEWMSNHAEEVRVCNDHEFQYTVGWEAFAVVNTQDYENDA